MGKYLPIIVTAEFGSLTRAGQILGYAQPNLGNIVTRFENELGVKLFIRDQRGVRLTEVGEELLDVMRQVEQLEKQMLDIARNSKRTFLRVGVFHSAATQWMPGIIEAFRQEYPETVIEMKYLGTSLDGELGLKNGTLDCTFFCGEPPAGIQNIALLKDAYHLVVSEKSPLAECEIVSAEDIAGKYPFIISELDANLDSEARDIYQSFARSGVVKNLTQDAEVSIALVERDVGVSILSDLSLHEVPPEARIKVLPFQEPLKRTISLLYPKETEHAPSLMAFLRLVRRQVELWKQAQEAVYGDPFQQSGNAKGHIKNTQNGFTPPTLPG